MVGMEASASQPTLADAPLLSGGPKSVSFAPPGYAASNGAASNISSLLPAKSKSNFAVRKWLAVNTEGELRHLELAKLRVTHYLGVQLRDLRLLDPQLATSYPSAILARERAIVCNLEFIKCIIAQDNIYITNLDDPHTLAFVEELQRRLRHPGSSSSLGMFAPSSSSTGGSEGGGQAHEPAPPTPRLSSTMAAPENLPFELRVLEVALDTVAKYIEQMSGDLELAAHPALDALTSTINTSNLERVRRIKNRMVRLTTRVETLREVLEKFLDDDSDMKDLNLTAKEEDRAELEERRSGQALSFDVPMPFTGMSGGMAGAMPAIDSLPETPRGRRTGGSLSSASSDSTSLDDDPAVEVVEMVMEPYFMQVDNTYNKLQTLCEYIDDTEDYISIELDSHRNALIKLDLVLTSFSASVALVTAITGLFAMNVMLQPETDGQAPYSWFLAISISTGTGAIVLFISIMVYCRWQRLI